MVVPLGYSQTPQAAASDPASDSGGPKSDTEHRDSLWCSNSCKVAFWGCFKKASSSIQNAFYLLVRTQFKFSAIFVYLLESPEAKLVECSIGLRVATLLVLLPHALHWLCQFLVTLSYAPSLATTGFQAGCFGRSLPPAKLDGSTHLAIQMVALRAESYEPSGTPSGEVDQPLSALGGTTRCPAFALVSTPAF